MRPDRCTLCGCDTDEVPPGRSIAGIRFKPARDLGSSRAVVVCAGCAEEIAAGFATLERAELTEAQRNAERAQWPGDRLRVMLQPVAWLWPGRIPLGKLTIIDGDPGLGKSLVTVDLAARVSTGITMPDGASSDLEGPADVVMLLAEDAADDTVRPRLDAAGADAKRVHELQGASKPNADGIRPVTLEDVRIIREAIDEKKARLVVIDPFAAFVGRRNSHRDEEMRAVLTPLAACAEQTGAAVVVIRHVRKSSGSAVTQGAGSIGITGAARSVLFVGQDPKQEDGRVLAVSKMNLAAPAPSLSFTIETRKVEGLGEVPRVAWGEASEASADDLAAAAREDARDKSQTKEAAEWILDELADEPQNAEDLEKHAVRAGHSKTTFQRARARLSKAHKVWKHKEPGVCGAWWWGLGAEPSPEWMAERAKWAAVGA